MQTLQQELDPSQQSVATQDHPVLRGLMADQAVAYAEEVRALRQRVAVLEAELAAAKAAQAIETQMREAPPLTSIDVAPPCRQTPGLATSEFTEPDAPAVVAVAPAQMAPAPHAAPSTAPEPAAAVQDVVASATEPVPNAGFAQAWTSEEETSSFEEKIAERAFFQASSVDEQSRSWLLES